MSKPPPDATKLSLPRKVETAPYCWIGRPPRLIFMPPVIWSGAGSDLTVVVDHFGLQTLHDRPATLVASAAYEDAAAHPTVQFDLPPVRHRSIVEDHTVLQ